MNFYKKNILAILMISTIFSCKNSTDKVKSEKNTGEDSSTHNIGVKSEKATGEDTSTYNIGSKRADATVFHKSLAFQNFHFDISTTGEGSSQQLTIESYGLKTDNKKITQEIIGRVTNAEIEDLNSDGFPEILIYITSAGSGSYGNVIGYSVNNGKSMSQIYFPSIADNPKANKGYMGHDEFAIMDKILTQRFTIYNVGDINSNPTGNIRQIQYRLEDGESSRKLVVDKIIEYPVK